MRTMEYNPDSSKAREYNVALPPPFGKKNGEVIERLPAQTKLMRDYQTPGDGIYWLMSAGACIKSVYSDKDREDAARLNSETPITDGEIVLIEGEQYSVKVLGAYSDCAILSKVMV